MALVASCSFSTGLQKCQPIPCQQHSPYCTTFDCHQHRHSRSLMLQASAASRKGQAQSANSFGCSHNRHLRSFATCSSAPRALQRVVCGTKPPSSRPAELGISIKTATTWVEFQQVARLRADAFFEVSQGCQNNLILCHCHEDLLPLLCFLSGS